MADTRMEWIAYDELIVDQAETVAREIQAPPEQTGTYWNHLHNFPETPCFYHLVIQGMEEFANCLDYQIPKLINLNKNDLK